MSVSRFPQLFLWSVCVSLVVVGPVAAQKAGKVPAHPMNQLAEVTASDVYVRCGASTNHYPVCKLSAGDRVTVVNERQQWYEILPPEGVFSWISEVYVDTMDNKAGVVNGHKVRVRAGSVLPRYAKHRSQPQTLLPKGAEVTIVGKSPDAWLKIVPPEGVTLWINRQYVELVPSELVLLERETKAAAIVEDATGLSSTSLTKKDGASGTPDKKVSAGDKPLPFAAVPGSAAREELAKIDAGVREQMEKPLLDRQFSPLIKRYETIAKQEEDDFARRYAEKRIAQLEYMTELLEAVRKVRSLSDEADVARRQHLKERAKMRMIQPSMPGGFDAQGELRPSALYSAKTGPRRYRLVDPSTSPGRTIGYVEIPAGSEVVIDEFLGRYVGVRAAEKRLLPGGVKPIPIYIASELVVLQPEASE